MTNRAGKQRVRSKAGGALRAVQRRASRSLDASVRAAALTAEDTRRVIIEGVQPVIDGGRFPIKRSIGQAVTVGADIFIDGHDKLAAVLRYRHTDESAWQEVRMALGVNDRWSGSFTVTRLGRYECGLAAWIDYFASWRDGLQKKVDAKQDVSSELLEGADLARRAAKRAAGADARWLRERGDVLGGTQSVTARIGAALDSTLAVTMARYPDRSRATQAGRVFEVTVDPEYATFGAWYEMFPRSCATTPGKHGTFADCEARLPYIASMGFDVLYLPPIHPIGGTHRKGANNTPQAKPGDPGSPWAIGASDGGHTAVHSDLGTLEDFRRLVAKAEEIGIHIALDIAFQCTPEHPYVKEHPEWFCWRPDGTIQYAENPPKKYQDIYPLNFDTAQWRELWEELKSVILFWVAHGVKIFRVDNPHTKPFPFWEWLIREVRREYPEVIFLSEAFTRPKVMRCLAKCGFSQSYTYFTWRNTKEELTEYLTELTQTGVREYLRPNFFVNTPDILHEYLQRGGRPAFQIRAVLAAMSVGSYGIYGPGFELCDGQAVPGTEEYQDSEKYQLRHWDIDRADSLHDFIARLNEIRREHPALRFDRSLRFLDIDNDQLICFAKCTPDHTDVVVVAVNLDPHHTQAGWVSVPLETLGIDAAQPYQMHELLSDARYHWHGPRNFVALDPGVVPAHIFAVRQRVRSEREFDYY